MLNRNFVNQEASPKITADQFIVDANEEGFCVIEVLFDDAGCPIDYRFLETNQAFVQQTGLHNAIGKRVKELAPDHEQHWFDTYGQIALTGEAKRFKNDARHLGERGYLYDVYAFRLGDPAEHKVAVFFHDISERVKAEEALQLSEDKFSILFDKSVYPVTVNQFNTGITVDVNQAWVETFGYSKQEALGKTTLELGLYQDPSERQKVYDLFLKNNSIRDYKLSLRTKTGTPLIMLGSMDRVEIADESYLLVTLRDITDLELVDKSLRENQAFLLDSLESIHDSFFSLDKDWRITYANHVFAGYMKVNADDVVGEIFWEVFPKYCGTEIEQFYRKAMEQREPVHFQSGGYYTEFWFDISIYPTKNGLSIFSKDRTQELQAQKALSESEKRYRELVEHAPSGIYEIDLFGKRFVSVNDTMCTISGYSREELLAMNPSDLLDEDSQKLFQQRIAQCLKGDEPDDTIEYTVIAKGGRKIEVILNTTFYFDQTGRPDSAFVIAHDVTARKRVEEALRDSEARFTLATEAAELGIHDYDLTTGAIQWDSRLRRLWGVGEDEPITVDLFKSAIHPEDRPRIDAELQRTVNPQGSGKFAQEYRIINLIDHKVYWVYATSHTTFKGDQAVRLVGTVEDITRRKEIEQALSESEQKFRELVQSVNGVILRWDHTGKITFMNEYGLQFFGYKEEQMIGKPASILVPRRDSEGQDLTTLASDIIDSPMRYASNLNENVRSDGSRVWMAWNNRPIFDENGNLKEILAVGTDMTEIRRMEQTLQEYTRKLEESNAELERFAYVASHDLQEPLRKIKAFGERLTVTASDQLDQDSLDFLGRIQNASQRMQTMIDGLLQLSRVTTKGLPFVNVDLNNIAEAVLDDLQVRIETSGGKVELGSMPEIQADPIQMHQLFMNLIANALKFHEPGKTPVVEVYSKLIDNTDLGEKNELKIYVRDNGIGFDEQHLDRIFRPLERLVGRSQYEGSGMGLAICKKIVERHGGTITAKSMPGVGSTFIITLPQ